MGVILRLYWDNGKENGIYYLGFRVICRPLINEPPPLNRDYTRDPNTKAVKRRWFLNHGSTLSHASF